MALLDTHFAVHEQSKCIPSADEWYTDIQQAREDAVIDAENSGDTIVITEINTRALLITRAEIRLEAL